MRYFQASTCDKTIETVLACLQMTMLGLGTVLQRPSTSSSISAQTVSPRTPRRLACRVPPCAALVTDTPRPKTLGTSSGNGKVGENGPTIINGQVGCLPCVLLLPLDWQDAHVTGSGMQECKFCVIRVPPTCQSMFFAAYLRLQ